MMSFGLLLSGFPFKESTICGFHVSMNQLLSMHESKTRRDLLHNVPDRVIRILVLLYIIYHVFNTKFHIEIVTWKSQLVLSCNPFQPSVSLDHHYIPMWTLFGQSLNNRNFILNIFFRYLPRDLNYFPRKYLINQPTSKRSTSPLFMDFI
jgi:hypothetical protein